MFEPPRSAESTAATLSATHSGGASAHLEGWRSHPSRSRGAPSADPACKRVHAWQHRTGVPERSTETSPQVALVAGSRTLSVRCGLGPIDPQDKRSADPRDSSIGEAGECLSLGRGQNLKRVSPPGSVPSVTVTECGLMR